MVRVKDLYINQDFTLKGEWTIPKQQEDSTIGGNISYSNEGINLELYGSFDINKIEIINGYCEGNIAVTLIEGFEVSHHYGSVEITKLAFNKMILGEHFTAKDQVKLSDYKIKYTYLEDWFEDRIFHSNLTESYPRELTIKYTQPEANLNCKISSDNEMISIMGASTFTHSSHRYEKTINHQNWIKLNAGNSELKSLSWFEDTERKVRSFLIYLMNRPVYYTQITAKLGVNQEEKIPRYVYIYPPRSNEVNLKKVRGDQLFIRFEEIKDNIEQILNNWFEIHFEKTSINYADTFYEKSNIATKFLEYTKVLESLHRDTNDGAKYLSKSRFEKLRSKMIESISEDVDNEEFIQKLRGDLSYSYQFSFRDRLRYYFINIQDDVKLMIFGEEDIEEIIQSITQTRNYYTHYGKKQKKVIEEGINLYFVNVMLQIVSFYWIGKELGLKDTQLSNALSRDSYILSVLKKAQLVFRSEE